MWCESCSDWQFTAEELEQKREWNFVYVCHDYMIRNHDEYTHMVICPLLNILSNGKLTWFFGTAFIL